MIRSVFAFLSVLSLTACAGGASAAPQPEPVLLAARLLKEPKLTMPNDSAARSTAGASQPALPPARHALAGKPLAEVEAANRSAVREPDADSYLGAVQVYPWNEGALYRLYAAPGKVSDIALEPGETLVSVASGDTVRWIIGDTTSGSGAARQTHILVKPSAAGLATNLVIATDRRVYHVEAQSHAHSAMASISWIYPGDALLALRGRSGGTADPPVAAGVALDSLNFDYRIEGANPPWRPLRAFDDGRQVFIEFPPALAQGEAPPLFVTGEAGRAELVNYRIRGHYYVVDRLFAAAELRLGEERQQVVRIVRVAVDARQGRRGS